MRKLHDFAYGFKEKKEEAKLLLTLKNYHLSGKKV
jgi:hypothetical protein